jgi:hypothetical protein
MANPDLFSHDGLPCVPAAPQVPRLARTLRRLLASRGELGGGGCFWGLSYAYLYMRCLAAF